MQIPGFVEDGVVTRLDNARVKVEIDNVLVSGCVPKEYTGEVMAI